MKPTSLLIRNVAIIFFMLSCTAAFATETSYEDSVVMIQSVSQNPDFVTPWKSGSVRQGVGSGLIIEGNRILTNAHNVSNSRYIIVKKQNCAQKFMAMVKFIGNDCDLALLKVQDEETFFANTHPLELGPLPVANSTVSTYGFPMGGNLLSVTEGVVSRIQVDRYSHTAGDLHLVIQTDAAINPGNSGGPVMQDDNVVGIAFQGLTSADNIGYMIPTTVIKHFLKDIEDGQYDGFANMGLSYFPGLHSKSYAKYLKIPDSEQGVVVLNVMLGSSLEGKLQQNDVIVNIAGYDVDNDGNIKIHDLLLNLSEAIEMLQIGESTKITFYRNGEKMSTTVEIAYDNPLVKFSRIYDQKPRYYQFAGFVFVPLNRNFLETWGSEWTMDIPHYLKLLLFHSSELNDDPDLEEYVVISEILPDEVNSYCSRFEKAVVKSINDCKINSLNDIPEVIKKCEKDFIEITFYDKTKTLILDRKKALEANPQIMNTYNVTADSQLED